MKDQELLQLGMTLPGFEERSQVIASLPSLSLLTLANFTPDHRDITYLEIDQLTEFSDCAFAGFDVVGISALTARIFDAYRVADQFRILGSTVVHDRLSAACEERWSNARISCSRTEFRFGIIGAPPYYLT